MSECYDIKRREPIVNCVSIVFKYHCVCALCWIKFRLFKLCLFLSLFLDLFYWGNIWGGFFTNHHLFLDNWLPWKRLFVLMYWKVEAWISLVVDVEALCCYNITAAFLKVAKLCLRHVDNKWTDTCDAETNIPIEIGIEPMFNSSAQPWRARSGLGIFVSGAKRRQKCCLVALYETLAGSRSISRYHIMQNHVSKKSSISTNFPMTSWLL